MKRYGANTATEFTRKQIGVIFKNAKNGSLKVEKWMMSNMYNMADFYGVDFNGQVEREEREIKGILDAVFAGNLEEAQNRINLYTESLFSSLTTKYQNKADRSFVC